MFVNIFVQIIRFKITFIITFIIVGVVRRPHSVFAQIVPENKSRTSADKCILVVVQTHASSNDAI